MRKNKIKYTNLGSKVKGAVVTITDPKKTTDAVSFLRKGIETGIVVASKDNKLNLSFTDQYIIDTNNQTVEQSWKGSPAKTVAVIIDFHISGIAAVAE